MNPKEATDEDPRKRGLELIGQLMELDSDTFDVREEIKRYRRVPMRHILAQVPGATETAKAGHIGVSRQTWHRWKRGERPSAEQAERLSKLTRFTVKQIVG